MAMMGMSNRVFNQATSAGFSPSEKNMLSKIKDPAQKAQMEAQLMMQKEQQITQFISNVLRIKADTSKGIIQNIR